MPTRRIVMMGVLVTFLNAAGFGLYTQVQRNAAYSALLTYGQGRLARASRGEPLTATPFVDTVDGRAVEVTERAWRFLSVPERGRHRERLVEVVVRVRTLTRPVIEAEAVGLTTEGTVGHEAVERPRGGAFPPLRPQGAPPRR